MREENIYSFSYLSTLSLSWKILKALPGDNGQEKKWAGAEKKVLGAHVEKHSILTNLLHFLPVWIVQ